MDELIAEKRRLENFLNTIDPGTDQYDKVLQRVERIQRLLLADSKEAEEQFQLRHQRKIDEERLNLEKERLNLEKEKLDAERNEAAARKKMSKRDAAWDLAKIAAQGVVMVAGIVITGKFEQVAVLPKNMFAFVPKMKF